MTTTCYLIAGEASGDMLGAGLMRELKAHAGENKFRFFGVGGEKMEAEGLNSLFPYYELSMMGFLEIVPHLHHMVSRIGRTVEDIQLKHPDIIITIDSPGFNFRVVEKLRKLPECKNTLFVHYVAPTVWAYKPRRAKKCAALFDHMLVLLPFEPPYFEKEGLDTTFVGHPVANRKKQWDGAHFREKYDLAPDATLVAMLPGSREGEVKRHMPVFGPTITGLSQLIPNLALVVPVHPRLLPMLGNYFEQCPFRAVLVSDEQDKREALAASNLALVKSGTISLEVAQAKVPQVVTYKANALSAAILKAMIKVRFANLINIVCDREVIPEFLQRRCKPSYLIGALETLLKDKEKQQTQLAGVEEAFQLMKAPQDSEPHILAAKKIVELLANKNSS